MENKNTLERFIRKIYELFAGEPDMDKRWTAAPRIMGSGGREKKG